MGKRGFATKEEVKKFIDEEKATVYDICDRWQIGEGTVRSFLSSNGLQAHKVTTRRRREQIEEDYIDMTGARTTEDNHHAWTTVINGKKYVDVTAMFIDMGNEPFRHRANWVN